MDKFEKQLVAWDKKDVNARRMEETTKESIKAMRDDGKYYKEYKEKLIDLRF